MNSSSHGGLRPLEPRPSTGSTGLGMATGMAGMGGGPKPVNPFSLSCRFDRARGQFVVHAGARAGGLCVVGLALLAGTALAFLLGTSFRAGASGGEPAATKVASAADAPAVTFEPAAAAQRPAPQAKSTSSASKRAKQSKQKKQQVAAKAGKSSEPKATQQAVNVATETQPRQKGLNYLVLKTYTRLSDARDARDALAAQGVPATVERDLPGWARKGLYSIVGTTGFDMDTQRAAFDRHVRELKGLKLQPAPYRWRGTPAASTTETAAMIFED